MPTPRSLRPVILVLACAIGAIGAEKPAKGGGGVAGEDAGKADAKAAFARQAGNATKPGGAAPGFVGAYIWGGRADQNYRPFFQWEFRLAGGSGSANGLRARIATLGPSRQVLVQGDWKDWGSLAAGAALDADYRANCPNFPAYQVELQWSAGGKETYIACDKGTVPVPLGALGDQGYVVAVAANFELDEKAKSAVVTWTDWNLGGRTAKDVVQTIHLRDANLKELKAIPFKPEGGELAPLAVKEQKLTIAKPPAFATLSISTEQADSQQQSGTDFTGAKDVEVAKVRAEAGKLKARVRNGLDADQEGLVVTVALLDKAGKQLGSFEIPVGHLGKGEEKDVATELGKVDSWAGVETSWRGGAAAAQAAASAASASTGGLPGPVSGDGLTFTPRALERTPSGLLLSGTVANATGKDLGAIRVTFTVTDSAKRSQEVVWKTPALAAGAEGKAVMACTVKDVTGLTMTWKTGTVE